MNRTEVVQLSGGALLIIAASLVLGGFVAGVITTASMGRRRIAKRLSSDVFGLTRR